MKKMVSIMVILSFLPFIFNSSLYADFSSYKKWAWPLLGVSALAIYGSTYFHGKAKEAFTEAETLHDEYLAVPKGAANSVFEEKYEAYEDKYEEGKSNQTYYLLCLGGGVLALAGSIFLLAYNPSSEKVSIGYNMNYVSQCNDLHMNYRF